MILKKCPHTKQTRLIINLPPVAYSITLRSPSASLRFKFQKKHWKFQKSIGNSQKALEIPKKQGNSKKALEIPKKHWKFPKSKEIPKKSIGNSKKSLGMALCNVHILLRMEYLKYSVLSHLGKAFDPVYLEMTK